MPTIYYDPPLAAAYKSFAAAPGGPNHGIIGRAHHLELLGWTPTNDLNGADIRHVTGVIPAKYNPDVHTINYVWPTDLNPAAPQWWFEHNKIMQDTGRRSKVVLALSAYVAAAIDELLGLEPVIIPQAFNHHEWDREFTPTWRPRYNIAPDEPVVLWPKMTADWLRDPLPAVYLAAERPEVHVFIPVDAQSVTAWVGRALPPNVHCVGNLLFPQYQELVKECDIYLATMLGGASHALLEAMYAGKPVLGYDGASEIITGPKSAGILVQKGDINALVDAFADVWRKRKSLGNNAHRKAQAYTWEKIAPMYVNLYEAILSDG